jgi:HAD superfamily hydrolase (TIGR01509 family)
VIFDMDGLMLATETISRGIWQRAAVEMGYTITDDLFSSFIGRTEADCQAVLEKRWGPTFVFARMHERILSQWAELFATGSIPRKPGLLELIAYVDSLGLPKAVATSSRRDNALAKLGHLAEQFPVLVTGDDISRGKPAPDIFLLAAAQLGVKPEDCLVLEDSWPGVQAAQAAGSYVIMVPDLSPTTESAPHVCSSLHEAQLWLERHQAAAKQPRSS